MPETVQHSQLPADAQIAREEYVRVSAAASPDRKELRSTAAFQRGQGRAHSHEYSFAQIPPRSHESSRAQLLYWLYMQSVEPPLPSKPRMKQCLRLTRLQLATRQGSRVCIQRRPLSD